MDNQNFIALRELAGELDVKKSKLLFYADLGLIQPIATFGKTRIYDKTVTLKQLDLIKKKQLENKTLSQIQKELT